MSLRDSYFSGSFPTGYLGGYFPGVATTPDPEPGPSGGGSGYWMRPRRITVDPLPPTVHRARLRASMQGRASARARRSARALVAAPVHFSARATARPIYAGDEEACLAAAMLLS